MPQEIDTSISKVKKWMAGLTSVLILVPALMNSVLDIYRYANDIPTSQAEIDNKNYYAQYFGKTPVFKGEVPLVTEHGKVTLSLEVHSKGDILVHYGMRSQWFPFPKNTVASVRPPILPIFSAAYAEENKSYVQQEMESGNKIIRKNYYPDGEVQVITIDPKTGNWSQPQIQQYKILPEDVENEKETVIKVYQFPEINIKSKQQD